MYIEYTLYIRRTAHIADTTHTILNRENTHSVSTRACCKRTATGTSQPTRAVYRRAPAKSMCALTQGPPPGTIPPAAGPPASGAWHARAPGEGHVQRPAARLYAAAVARPRRWRLRHPLAQRRRMQSSARSQCSRRRRLHGARLQRRPAAYTSAGDDCGGSAASDPAAPAATAATVATAATAASTAPLSGQTVRCPAGMKVMDGSGGRLGNGTGGPTAAVNR